MQTRLFDEEMPPESCHVHRMGSVRLLEYPNGIPEEEAHALFRELLDTIDWQQEQLRIAGRVIDVPRLQCWMGDRESHYGYSGMRLTPTPWHPAVQSIRQRVERLCGGTFNSVLLNLYRNGNDSVSWHADDEKELGATPIIASVSLGATRRFQLKPKPPATGPTRELQLSEGNVLIMEAGMQSNWIHQVPKEKRVTTPRINLTFRRITPNAR